MPAVGTFSVFLEIFDPADGTTDGVRGLGRQNYRVPRAIEVENAVALMIKIGIQIVVPALVSLDCDLLAVIEADIEVDCVFEIHMFKRGLDVGLVIDGPFHSRVNDLAAIGAVNKLHRHARHGKGDQHHDDIAEYPHLHVVHIEYSLAEEEKQSTARRKQYRARDRSLQDHSADMGFQIIWKVFHFYLYIA